jgi:hypothetical protein
MTRFAGTSITITTNYNRSNQWLSKTRSIPCWTTNVFSSTVTDLVLIYESVTSSASGIRWLTLHSWTLNYSYEWRLTNALSFITRGEPVTTSNNLAVLICFIRCYETCVDLVATSWFVQTYSLLRNAFLVSRCLAMDYSVTTLNATQTTFKLGKVTWSANLHSLPSVLAAVSCLLVTSGVTWSVRSKSYNSCISP